MSDLVDQLRRYGDALERAVEPVDVAGIADERAPAADLESSRLESLRLERGARPRRRAWWAAAAAVVLVVAIGAALLVSDARDRARVATEPESPTATAGPTFGYEPGWHELDPGPLAPRSGGAPVWTGDELIVLGGERHTDGAAYDPVRRTWRPIATSPLPRGVPEVVWTGEEVVAVVQDADRLVTVAAAYDPDDDSWRLLGDAPPPVGPRLRGLVWTGDEVVLLESLAALDPATGAWRDLLPPHVPFPYTPFAAWAWTGEELVVAEFEHETLVHRPAARSTGFLPAPPDPTPGFRRAAAAVAVDGEVVLVDEDGNTTTLDLVGERWSELSTVGPADQVCQPAGVVVGGRPVVDVCTGLYQRDPNGTWRPVAGFDGTCCYPNLVSTGEVLFQWASNDDEANDPQAPYRRLRLWVPDP